MNEKNSVTAKELLAQVNADPEYRRKRAEEERIRAKRVAEERQAQAPLIHELRSAGLDLDSIGDLLNNSSRSPMARSPRALSILVEHLQRPYPPNVRASIARALAVPEAKFTWDRLVHLYRNELEPWPKDSLAVTLAAIANDAVIDDVIRLAKDHRNGSSRVLLLGALERSSDPKAYATLVDLQNDAELKKEVAVLLRRRKKKSARVPTLAQPVEGAIDEVSETSMNFDSPTVEPFLERLSIGNFGRDQIGEVLRSIDELDVDSESSLRFQVSYKGQTMPMTIRVFKDDADAIDLYFFAPKKLIEEIDRLMEIFAIERGL